MKNQSHQIKKLIDYLKLFSEVNQELIERDLDKKKRGKKTNRFPISPMFLEVTRCINLILKLLKEINIISIS